MATEAKNTNYWISSTALSIQLNSMGEPDYIQCSVVSGASVLCYMSDVPGLGYDAGHNYQRWTLAAYPSIFPDSKRKYVYIAIPRQSTTDNNQATVVFPGQKIDIYGKTIPSSGTEGVQIGNEAYYYIFTGGIISAVKTDADNTRKREWEQHFDCGKLATDEAIASGGEGAWWRYNSVSDTITFLKEILKANFNELSANVARVTSLFLGGHKLKGVADSNGTLETSDDTVVTPHYLGQFGVKHFLAKDKDDTAHGTITWEKVQKFFSGLLIGNSNNENGGSWTTDAEGRSHLITDYLEVRMKAIFEELVINKTSTIGGKEIISPAGGVVAHKVEEVTVTYNNVSQKAYRCYFLAEQEGNAVDNDFAVGDQVRSESFNVRKGTYHKAGNHFYWRLVIGRDEDPVELEGKKYHYIDLSDTDCATASDVPAKGDVLNQCGNRTDVERQNCLIFSAVDTYSPSISLYHGINSYSFANREYVEYGVNKQTNRAFFHVYGDMYFGDRPTSANNYEGDSYVKYDSETKKVTIKGDLDIKSTYDGKTLDKYIAEKSLDKNAVETIINKSQTIIDLQNQIDGAIETWFYDGVPTLKNAPAISWKTDNDKKTHLGDLYYDNKTGKAYRFAKDGSTYEWIIITDTELTKALKDSSQALKDAAAADKKANGAQATANTKRRIFGSQPVPPYDVNDMWVNATYPNDGSTYKNEILKCSTAKAEGEKFDIADWKLASKYTDDTKAEEAKKAAEKAQEEIKTTQSNLNALGTTVTENKKTFDSYVKDGYLEPSEIAAMAQDSKRLEDAFAAAEKSYNEVKGAEVLKSTKELTDLNTAFTTLSTAKTELVTYLSDISTNYNKADTNGKAAIVSAVGTKFTNFQSAYSAFYDKLGLANAYITSKIYGDLKQNITDLAGYKYLKDALGQTTHIDGGLVMTTLLALRDGDGNVQSGINGAIDTNRGKKSIATWWGGQMVDKDYNSGNLTPATSLIRFDGSGYLANGAIWWDVSGKVHADPTSFIISEKNLGAYLTFFEPTWKEGSAGTSVADLVSLKPNAPFSKLGVSGDATFEGAISFHGIKLTYDSKNKAIKIDGNLYTTGGITAYGAGASTTGGGGLIASVISYARIIEGNYTDADLTSIPNAYAIKALSSRIDNIASELGGLSLSWNNITGKPSTFTPSAHTHKWTEITDRITKVSQLTNDKGYLTAHQSLASYYTKAEIDAKGYTTNKGTVTSVALTLPTGLTCATKTITTSGTFAISLASGYSIPTTAKQTAWDGAVSAKHTHSNKSVLDGITSTKVTCWDSAYDWYALITTDEETADGVINKWNEVVSFLANIAQTNTLSGIVDGINKSISDEVTRAKKAEGVNASGISANKGSIATLQGYFTNGSAKKALQLTNARKLWGNSFNGTADINGSIIVPSGKYISIGNIKLEYDATNKALKITNTTTEEVANLYTSGGVSAYGVGASSSSGGGLNGSVKAYADAIRLTTENLSEIASAYSVAKLYSEIQNVANAIPSISVSVPTGGNALTGATYDASTGVITFTKGTFLTAHQSLDGYVNAIAVSGSGNAVTAVTKSGKTITFTKGATYLTSHQSLSNYYTKSSVDSLLNGKSATTHTHSVKINGVTKTIAATGGTAVDLGTYLTSHQSLAGYATQSWVNSKGYITSSGSCAYATSAGNADTVDGEHASAFTRIVGRHTFLTSGTAPYNYIHLFRIANSNGYSTLDCEIDIRTRYHSAKIEIRISTAEHPYNNGGSSISIVKKVVSGRTCNLWFLPTVQSSNYNYYDVYYESAAWDSGSYGITLKGTGGTLVFKHKGTKLTSLPDKVSPVTDNVAASATKLQTARKLWGNSFNGTADINGSIIVPSGKYISIGNIKLEYDATNKALKITNTTTEEVANLYTSGGVSAYGVGASSSSGGGLNGSVKAYADAIRLTTENLSEIASAYSVAKLYSEIQNVANAIPSISVSVPTGGNALTGATYDASTGVITFTKGTFLTAHQSLDGYVNAIAVSGSGNAVTAVTKSGKTITFTKGATYLTSHQSLSNYYTKSSVDSLLNGKSATTHTHSVKINGVTKTIAATGGTAVDLGTYLTSHQSLAGYATQSWVNSKGYITSSGSCAYATSAGNADTVDGEHASAFTRIVGRHTFLTSGTAPYNYIHLFRIANSNGYSTLDCEIDIRTRYHSAKIEIRISTAEHPYNNGGSSISIVKKVVSGRTCNLWFLPTVQSSNYNYYDVYYESAAWDSGSYGITLKGTGGTLVFKHKGTKLTSLPDKVSPVTDNVAASATKLQTARKLWGNSFNGTADINGSIIVPSGKYISIGNIKLEYDATNKALKITNTTTNEVANFYATGGITAYGEGSGSSGGGGLNGSVKSYADALKLASESLSEIASAYSIKALDSRISSLEGGSATAISVSGSGNAVTSVTKNGTTISVVKGSTFSLSGHTHKWADITDRPSSLKNPSALSWSGYSSGSYDGSAAKSISIPNNTNQLTNGAGFITASASITGNAATATKVNHSLSVFGKSFNGSADVTVADTDLIASISTATANLTDKTEILTSYASDNGFNDSNAKNRIYRRPASAIWGYINSKTISNADKLDNVHLNGIFTALSNTNNGVSMTIGTVAKSLANMQVYSATKLVTARNIALNGDLMGNANFDGSANITINGYMSYCNATVSNTNTYPWRRIAKVNELTGNYSDGCILLYISEGFNGGYYGIARVYIRTDNLSTGANASCSIQWISRNGYGLDSLKIAMYKTTGKAYYDVFLKMRGAYGSVVIRTLQDQRGGLGKRFILVNSTETTNAASHTEAYATIEDAATAIHNQAYTSIAQGSDVATVHNADMVDGIHASGLFTNLSNNGNNLSITIGGTNKTLTVGYATKAAQLNTARTLWGQSFDGTGNVNGALSGATTISASNTISTTLKNGALKIGNKSTPISAIDDEVIFNTGGAIRFGETAWDFNQWAGLKYNHSDKTIYLGIADNSVFNANSAQSNGTLKFPGITTITPDGGARIGGSGGDLYLGNANNSNWVKVQDICSHNGSNYWYIYQNGNAHFNNIVSTGATINGDATINGNLSVTGLISNKGILPANYEFNNKGAHCYVSADALCSGITAITDSIQINQVAVQYSNDSGNSWTNYPMSNDAKFNLYASNAGLTQVYLGYNVITGNNDAEKLAQVKKNELIVSFYISNSCYAQPYFASVDISNGIDTICTVDILNNSGAIVETYTKPMTGWNQINYISLLHDGNAGYGVGNNDRRYIRFRFKHDQNTTALRNTVINKIRIFSFTKYSFPTDRFMGHTGHIYNFDYNMNTYFPNSILANGGVTAYQSSDIRLKQDLRKLDYLGIIKAMGGTYGFAWKKDNTRSIGWIAQHVLHNPQLKDIVETDEKGYYKINYWSPKLIATAFGAIEQVGDEVSRLKARVVFLESEVQRLSGDKEDCNKKRLDNKNINLLN